MVRLLEELTQKEIEVPPTDLSPLLASLDQIAKATGETAARPTQVSVRGGLSGPQFEVLREIRDRLPGDLSGVWDYKAGTVGSVALTGAKRLLAITTVGGGAGGTMTINAGDTIPIPPNFALAIAPMANLVDPTIVFTQTTAFFIEYLTGDES